MAGHNIHGTGLVLGTIGLLLRGPSGAGKSLLALALLDDAAAGRGHAMLVADDRIDLAIDSGRLVMRTPARIAGLIELRGRGIVSRPFVPQAGLDLVVDLVDTLERMPEPGAFSTALDGITIARAPVPRVGVAGLEHQLLLVREAARAVAAAPGRVKKTA